MYFRKDLYYLKQNVHLHECKHKYHPVQLTCIEINVNDRVFHLTIWMSLKWLKQTMFLSNWSVIHRFYQKVLSRTNKPRLCISSFSYGDSISGIYKIYIRVIYKWMCLPLLFPVGIGSRCFPPGSNFSEYSFLAFPLFLIKICCRAKVAAGIIVLEYTEVSSLVPNS